MSYSMTLIQWTRLQDCLHNKGIVTDYPPGRNDGFFYVKGTVDGLRNFHVHSFEKMIDDNMVFEQLLPKSSSFRSGEKIDLATSRTSDWLGACIGMNESTRGAVKALKECFEALGLRAPS